MLRYILILEVAVVLSVYYALPLLSTGPQNNCVVCGRVNADLDPGEFWGQVKEFDRLETASTRTCVEASTSDIVNCESYPNILPKWRLTASEKELVIVNVPPKSTCCSLNWNRERVRFCQVMVEVELEVVSIILVSGSYQPLVDDI